MWRQPVSGLTTHSAPAGPCLHGARILPHATWRAPALQTAEAALKEVQKSVAGFKAPQGKDLSTALRQYAEVAQGGRWNLKQELCGAAEQERGRLEAVLGGTKPRKSSQKRSAGRSPLGRPQGTPPPGVALPLQAVLEEASHSGEGPRDLLPGVLLSSAGWLGSAVKCRLAKQAVERGRPPGTLPLGSMQPWVLRQHCMRYILWQKAAEIKADDMLSSSGRPPFSSLQSNHP